METAPNYELLKDAYAIIDGIPESAIAFGAPRSKEGATLAEGTVCSPEGWLAQHPAFNRLGLCLSADGRSLQLAGEPGFDAAPASIMARVFGILQEEARELFGERSTFTSGDDSGLSDKTLWLQRAREYLKQKGQAGESPDTGMLATQLRDRGMAPQPSSPQ